LKAGGVDTPWLHISKFSMRKQVDYSANHLIQLKIRTKFDIEAKKDNCCRQVLLSDSFSSQTQQFCTANTTSHSVEPDAAN